MGHLLSSITIPYLQGRVEYLPMPCTSKAPSAAQRSHNCELPEYVDRDVTHTHAHIHTYRHTHTLHRHTDRHAMAHKQTP